MSDADSVKLKINGQIHDGWTSVQISQSLDALCSSFDLEIFDGAPIATGDACELFIGDVLILSGLVDATNFEISAQSRTLSISGRDKTCDLLDCSALNSPATWKAQKLDKIAKDLIAPFGLELEIEGSLGAAFSSFALEQGETVFDALTRLCRLRGLLLSSTPEGKVKIFTPTPEAVSWALVLGENIESMSVADNAVGRFSKYEIKGQHNGRETAAADARGPKATASDPGVKRYRPLLIIADEQSTLQGLQTRVNWEATNHKAQAQKVSINLMGWRAPDGSLYSKGVLVQVRADKMGVNAQLIVEDCDFVLDAGNRRTKLSLVAPEAYQPQPITQPSALKKPARRGTR